MPKERIYGGPLEDRTNDMLVWWANANSAHSKGCDGYDGLVTIGLADQGSDKTIDYAALDRTAINRLIRVLRRARDAAYGADA